MLLGLAIAIADVPTAAGAPKGNEVRLDPALVEVVDGEWKFSTDEFECAGITSHWQGWPMPPGAGFSSFKVAGFSRFRALVAVWDGDPGEAEHRVELDGRVLWQGTVATGDKPLAVDVDITGGQVLTLRRRQIRGDAGGFWMPRLVRQGGAAEVGAQAGNASAPAQVGDKPAAAQDDGRLPGHFTVTEQDVGPAPRDRTQWDATSNGSDYVVVVRRGPNYFVCCNGKESGPYTEVKSVTLAPSGASWAAVARTGDGWHCVLNGSSGTAFSELHETAISPGGRWCVAVGTAAGLEPGEARADVMEAGAPTRSYRLVQYGASRSWLGGIAFTRDDRHWVVSDDEQHCIVDGTELGRRGHFPVLSRDRKHVACAVVRDKRLYCVIDGAIRPTPFPYSEVSLREFARADGRLIWSVETTDGRQLFVEQAVSEPWREIDPLLVSADSQTVAYEARKGFNAGECAVVNNRVYGPYNEVRDLTMAPLGSLVAFVASRNRVRWVVVANGKESAEFEGIHDLIISPDGRRWACRGRRDDQWTICADGIEGPEHKWVSAPAFTAGGQQLAYAWRDEGRGGLQLEDRTIAQYDKRDPRMDTGAVFVDPAGGSVLLWGRRLVYLDGGEELAGPADPPNDFAHGYLANTGLTWWNAYSTVVLAKGGRAVQSDLGGSLRGPYPAPTAGALCALAETDYGWYVHAGDGRTGPYDEPLGRQEMGAEQRSHPWGYDGQGRFHALMTRGGRVIRVTATPVSVTGGPAQPTAAPRGGPAGPTQPPATPEIVLGPMSAWGAVKGEPKDRFGYGYGAPGAPRSAPDATAPASGPWPRDGRVALVVQGLASNPGIWTDPSLSSGDRDDFVGFLRTCGYDHVWGFHYDSSLSIRSNSSMLWRVLDQVMPPEQRIDIIAHSMGGLVARDAVEHWGLGDRVVRLVMLGTPNLGSPWSTFVQSMADRLPANELGFLLGSWRSDQPLPAGLLDLEVGSDFLEDLNQPPSASGKQPASTRYYAVAGNLRNQAGTNAAMNLAQVRALLLGVFVHGDGVVDAESANYAGLDLEAGNNNGQASPATRATVTVDHLSLTVHPDVRNVLRRWLAQDAAPPTERTAPPLQALTPKDFPLAVITAGVFQLVRPTSKERYAPPGLATAGYAPSFTADGGSLICVRDGDVWRFDLQTNKWSQLTHTGDCHVAQAHPKRSLVAYCRARNLGPTSDGSAYAIRLWLLDLTTGHARAVCGLGDRGTDRLVAAGPLGNVYRVSWHPDGRTVAVTWKLWRHDFWEVRLVDTSLAGPAVPRPYAPDGSAWGLVFAQSGDLAAREIYCQIPRITWSTGVQLGKWDGRAWQWQTVLRPFVEGEECVFNWEWPVFSPNGKWLAVTRTAGGGEAEPDKVFVIDTSSDFKTGLDFEGKQPTFRP